MKRFKTIILLLAGLLMVGTSCKDTKSYADYLEDEEKAIDLLISENGFNILKKFPENYIFGENDFYKDPSTGVYFNIISYGDSAVKPKLKETIYIRYKGLSYFGSEDTTRYTNTNSPYPEQFDYIGPISSITQDSYGTAGWVVPLRYVGHRGKVKLIIPFEMGSSYDQSNYLPSYYDQVEYKFDSQP